MSEHRDDAGTRGVLVPTSFPHAANPAAGIFVARLALHLARHLPVEVVAPAGTGHRESGVAELPVHLFRYAPRRWQRLAQGPGGIPAALKRHPWMLPLVPVFLLAMALAVARAAGRGSVVHANWSICGVVAGCVARLKGLPMVLTVRGEDVTRAEASRVNRLILALAVRLSDEVVTVSEAFRNALCEAFPDQAGRVRCIANGVDERFVRVGAQRAVRSADTSVSLLTVGSLIPRKGLDQLLDGLAAASSNCTLGVVGEGPEEAALRQRCDELGLTDRVRFEGAVAPDALPDRLASGDVFVLTSHSEGRPNVVLEAMAAAMPVIATDIDGVRELVCDTQTGLLFRDGDTQALARCIDRLAGDVETRHRLGNAGADRIRDLGLLWTQTATQYLQAYSRAAAARA